MTAPASAAASGPYNGERFRSDINGLRAIAIALVMAFHLARDAAPGGFIGVDVFFVISGYLMTRIILGRLDERRFGLLAFYLARLRRIWPALVVLCAVLACIGALGADPWTYERAMRDVPAALFFVSNVVFAGRAGYFTPGEDSTWLLHTWSLSVEWQFYLVFPLVLMALAALPGVRRWLWLALALVAAISLAVALAASTRSSATSFYQLSTRVWELLAGAMALGVERRWRPGQWTRAACHGLGLAGIAAGAWIAVPAAGWPSAVALLPVGGAALMIAAPPVRSVWAENPVVDLIGRASYSIYLWHWPLIVGCRYAGLPDTVPVALAEVAAMIGLGLASYWLVEIRLTAFVFQPRWTHWAPGLVAAAAVCAFAVIAVGARGFEAARAANLSPAVRAALADDRAAGQDWAYPGDCSNISHVGQLRLCSFGDPAARQVVVLGDSHAEQITPRYVRAFASGDGRGVTFVTHDGCLPIPGVTYARSGACAAWAIAAYHWIAQAGFRRVIIVSSWTGYFEPEPRQPSPPLCAADAGGCLTRWLGGPPLTAGQAFDLLVAEIGRLQAGGVEVVLIGPTPRGEAADPMDLYRHAFWSGGLEPVMIPRSAFEAGAQVTRSELQRVARLTGASLIDPLDGLCPQGACPFVSDGHALYMNPGHFRASAVTQPRFAYLDAWLAPASPLPMRLK